MFYSTDNWIVALPTTAYFGRQKKEEQISAKTLKNFKISKIVLKCKNFAWKKNFCNFRSIPGFLFLIFRFLAYAFFPANF